MSVEIHDNSKEVSAEIKAALLRGLEKCGLVAEGYAKSCAPLIPEFCETVILMW